MGVRVRGGGKVDITRKEGRLTALKLQSDRTTKYKVNYDGRSVEVQIERGKTFVLDGTLNTVD